MKLQQSDFQRIYIPNISAGLARSHRLIRIEQEKEQIFFNSASKLKLKTLNAIAQIANTNQENSKEKIEFAQP